MAWWFGSSSLPFPGYIPCSSLFPGGAYATGAQYDGPSLQRVRTVDTESTVSPLATQTSPPGTQPRSSTGSSARVASRFYPSNIGSPPTARRKASSATTGSTRQVSQSATAAEHQQGTTTEEPTTSRGLESPGHEETTAGTT
jgi:hypothetical protein